MVFWTRNHIQGESPFNLETRRKVGPSIVHLSNGRRKWLLKVCFGVCLECFVPSFHATLWSSHILLSNNSLVCSNGMLILWSCLYIVVIDMLVSWFCVVNNSYLIAFSMWQFLLRSILWMFEVLCKESLLLLDIVYAYPSCVNLSPILINTNVCLS